MLPPLGSGSNSRPIYIAAILVSVVLGPLYIISGAAWAEASARASLLPASSRVGLDRGEGQLELETAPSSV